MDAELSEVTSNHSLAISTWKVPKRISEVKETSGLFIIIYTTPLVENLSMRF